jgi:pimeloyl-ACP methyl ester carboxylesterase
MKLEILSRVPAADAHPTPLLFIHGAFSCARIWEPFFLPFFAERGYAAHAMSLRGHGGSEGRDRLSTTRLRDYVADVIGVMEGLPSTPVLIGTSLGGVIVQKVIADRSVPAAVLLASGPPHGMVPGTVRMLLSNPLLVLDMSLMQNLGPDAATLAGARRALFRADTPDDYIRTYLPPPNAEAPMVTLDLMGLDLPPQWGRRDMPVLVLGGEEDAFISPGAVETTALAFGTKAEMFPGMPHAMMLDRDWNKVATRIAGWLDQVLTRAAPAG